MSILVLIILVKNNIPTEYWIKVIIENIKGVDEVVSQESLDYVPNLRKIKPDYVVHGDDYKIRSSSCPT